jgi:hypothetical protein
MPQIVELLPFNKPVHADRRCLGHTPLRQSHTTPSSLSNKPSLSAVLHPPPRLSPFLDSARVCLSVHGFGLTRALCVQVSSTMVFARTTAPTELFATPDWNGFNWRSGIDNVPAPTYPVSCEIICIETSQPQPMTSNDKVVHLNLQDSLPPAVNTGSAEYCPAAFAVRS